MRQVSLPRALLRLRPGRSTAVRIVSELLWPVHTFGLRGRSNRIGALLVINQDAGNAQLGGTRLVLPPLTAHLNVPRPFNEDIVLTCARLSNYSEHFARSRHTIYFT